MRARRALLAVWVVTFLIGLAGAGGCKSGDRPQTVQSIKSRFDRMKTPDTGAQK